MAALHLAGSRSQAPPGLFHLLHLPGSAGGRCPGAAWAALRAALWGFSCSLYQAEGWRSVPAGKRFQGANRSLPTSTHSLRAGRVGFPFFVRSGCRVSPHLKIRLASWQPYRQCAALHLCSPHINEMPAISTGRLPSLPWSGRLGCLPRRRTRGGAAVGVLPAGAAHAGKGRGAADRPGRALLLRSGGALVVLTPAMSATHALRPLPFCCPLPRPSANRLRRRAASTHVPLLNPTTHFPATCRAAICSHHIGSSQRHCGAHVWRGRNRQAAQDGDGTPSCVHLSVHR